MKAMCKKRLNYMDLQNNVMYCVTQAKTITFCGMVGYSWKRMYKILNASDLTTIKRLTKEQENRTD